MIDPVPSITLMVLASEHYTDDDFVRAKYSTSKR